tara:strand:- start:765 stop:908 length:144 start_codon:yes stop_codon:yes gene_type:complete
VAILFFDQLENSILFEEPGRGRRKKEERRRKNISDKTTTYIQKKINQ